MQNLCYFKLQSAADSEAHCGVSVVCLFLSYMKTNEITVCLKLILELMLQTDIHLEDFNKHALKNNQRSYSWEI